MLLVDDEEGVRVAARVTLETGGYRVLVAADGAEALALYAVNAGSVAAVLTDLMMPLMDGVAFIRALRTLDGDLPVIAVTGLGEKAQRSQLKAMGIKTILQKPFAADTLLRAVHGALHPQVASQAALNGAIRRLAVPGNTPFACVPLRPLLPRVQKKSPPHSPLFAVSRRQPPAKLDVAYFPAMVPDSGGQVSGLTPHFFLSLRGT